MPKRPQKMTARTRGRKTTADRLADLPLTSGVLRAQGVPSLVPAARHALSSSGGRRLCGPWRRDRLGLPAGFLGVLGAAVPRVHVAGVRALQHEHTRVAGGRQLGR